MRNRTVITKKTFPRYAEIAEIKAKTDKTIIVLSVLVSCLLFRKADNKGINGKVTGTIEDIILNFVYSPMHKTLLSSQVLGHGSQKS